MDHHRWWVQSYGLDEKDPAVAQHELTMNVLELFGKYDQLNLANSAGLEILLREAQLTEWRFEERRLALFGGAAGGAGGENYQDVMVCPALRRHAPKEAESQVLVLKATRKAREERALAGRDG